MKRWRQAYVASSFSLRGQIPAVEGVLRKTGWSIIDRWWAHDEKGELPQTTKEFYASPVTQAIAARHWEAIREADAFVLVASQEERTKFTGAAVEFGFAHGIGKPCVILGEAKLSSMWAPAIHCKNLGQLETTMEYLDYSNSKTGSRVW